MKLISCQIDHFGKLSDVSYIFTDGLNVLCEPNGWGKSTFAAFLKAMFYGLDDKKGKDAPEKERSLYRPWQGGVFGGELSFETGGKLYRLCRIFGRTKKEDRFTLYDLSTNLESHDFGEKIGEELFGLDAVSFQRSVFLAQKDALEQSTDAIHAKLGQLVDNTNDINHYESAMARLKDAANKLSPNRATGSIRKRNGEILALRVALSQSASLDADYGKESEMLQNLQEEAESIRQERFLLLSRLKEEEKEEHERARQKRGKFLFILFVVGLVSVITGIFAEQIRTLLLLPGSALLAVVGTILFLTYERKTGQTASPGQTGWQEQTGQPVSSGHVHFISEIERKDARLEQLSLQIQQGQFRLQRLREQLDHRKDQQAELERSLELQRTEQESYEAVSKAGEYLQKAKMQLSARYLEPVTWAFGTYYSMMTSTETAGWLLDTNLEPKIREAGEYRSVDYFSAGSKDLIGICMRLALADAMFRQEKPFLIMDDPFVNLDLKRTREATRLLMNLKERYQIIYFTCHESRTLFTEGQEE